MTATIHQLRPRTPEQDPWPTTPDRMPLWLAVLEEESARRGLPSDVPAGVAAMEELAWAEPVAVARLWEASRR